jgi:prolipoprotein diacylglyceryltransferase
MEIMAMLVFFPFIMLGLLVLAGFVFSIWMLVDCVKREHSNFKKTFTKEGEYDKIIWVVFIFVGISLFHFGAILYFFLVKKNRKPAV